MVPLCGRRFKTRKILIFNFLLCSALHFSAALGKAESCAMLCKAGAEVDLQDKDGETRVFLFQSLASLLQASMNAIMFCQVCLSATWSATSVLIILALAVNIGDHRTLLAYNNWLWRMDSCFRRCDCRIRYGRALAVSKHQVAYGRTMLL